ncbi:MAG: ExbD/TolR family protein [Bythopirellula sp.]
MRIPHSSTIQREFGVSMTPMIDVVFLLLIFFVCTASFQIAEAVLPSPLSLGGSASTSHPPELIEPELERVVIEVSHRDGKVQLAVNRRPCPSLTRLSEILVALSDVDARLPVLLDIDGETPLGFAIDVYDCCRLAKFENIQFAAEAEE